MANPTITGTPAGIPDKKYLTVKCGEAITKGNVVRWADIDVDIAGETLLTSADAGIAVMQGDANTIPVGVALETGATGEYIRVQTRGLGEVAIVTAGNADDGDILYISASGVAASSAMGSITDGDLVLGLVGLALTEDTGTALAAGEYILMCGFAS